MISGDRRYFQCAENVSRFLDYSIYYADGMAQISKQASTTNFTYNTVGTFTAYSRYTGAALSTRGVVIRFADRPILTTGDYDANLRFIARHTSFSFLCRQRWNGIFILPSNLTVRVDQIRTDFAISTVTYNSIKLALGGGTFIMGSTTKGYGTLSDTKFSATGMAGKEITIVPSIYGVYVSVTITSYAWSDTSLYYSMSLNTSPSKMLSGTYMNSEWFP